jgi:hypothetical protein
MVEVHLSNLALKSYDTVTDNYQQILHKNDKEHGQTNSTGQDRQVLGPGNDPEESGFIQYTIFTTCIFFALLL